MKIIALIGIVLIGQSCTNDDAITAILNSPDKFQDEEVEVYGILHYSKENGAIYRIGSDTLDTKKAIAVEFSDIFMLLNTFGDGFYKKKVKIRGIFNKDNQGIDDKFFGTIEDAVMISD